MAKQLFSVPIFFIVFRETLEAAIIISVLLGLAEQIVQDHPSHQSSVVDDAPKEGEQRVASTSAPEDDSESVVRKRLVRKLRMQVRLSSSSFH